MTGGGNIIVSEYKIKALNIVLGESSLYKTRPKSSVYEARSSATNLYHNVSLTNIDFVD